VSRPALQALTPAERRQLAALAYRLAATLDAANPADREDLVRQGVRVSVVLAELTAVLCEDLDYWPLGQRLAVLAAVLSNTGATSQGGEPR